jgi:hypothetical protein
VEDPGSDGEAASREDVGGTEKVAGGGRAGEGEAIPATATAMPLRRRMEALNLLFIGRLGGRRPVTEETRRSLEILTEISRRNPPQWTSARRREPWRDAPAEALPVTARSC